MKYIIKKDGTREAYKKDVIINAVYAASINSPGGEDKGLSELIAYEIELMICSKGNEVSVKQIQDEINNLLIEAEREDLIDKLFLSDEDFVNGIVIDCTKTKVLEIIKRDGSKEEFDKIKIQKAILKSMKYSSEISDESVAEIIANEIEVNSRERGGTPTVSQVEDMVYERLIEHGQELTAKAYEGYRAVQAYKRETNTTDTSIFGLLDNTNLEVIDENSNKNGLLACTQRDCATCCSMKSIA